MTRPDMTFDDILATLLEDDDFSPNYETLLAVVEQHPEFADELADYFAALAFQLEEVSEPPHLDVEHFANLAVSEALNLLHARDSVEAAPLRLSKLVERAGLSEEEVATRVGITDEIFMKLDRGRISPTSGIPTLLVECLVAIVQASIREVWLALSLPKLASSRSNLLKSRQRAQVATETWEEAVNDSTLSDDEKARWLRAVGKGTGPP